MALTDLYSGDQAYVWMDEDNNIVFVTSHPNAVTITMSLADFLTFTKELNKAAIKVLELQKEEFEDAQITKNPK